MTKEIYATNSRYNINKLSILLTLTDLKVLFRGYSKFELQYWMLGYHPNNNAKSRGGSLKEKV